MISNTQPNCIKPEKFLRIFEFNSLLVEIFIKNVINFNLIYLKINNIERNYEYIITYVIIYYYTITITCKN